jgi:hypothetical protein
VQSISLITFAGRSNVPLFFLPAPVIYSHCRNVLLFAGNSALNVNGTAAQSGWENVVKLVVTTLVKLFYFIRLFLSTAERRLESIHRPAPPAAPAAAEEPRPRAISDEEVCACLQRLDNLESMCSHLAAKPPQIPEDKELILLSSFERIRSVEADLERTKRVSYYDLLLKI